MMKWTDLQAAFGRLFSRPKPSPRPPAQQPAPPAPLEDEIFTPRVRAFLKVIRACEGTDTPDGYRALFGYHPRSNPKHLFASFADHPRVRFYEKNDEFIRNGRRDYTTAAGAYQITESTWNDFTAICGPHDFSPSSQDVCAVWLIRRAKAWDDVRGGSLEVALRKCSVVWASLPGSPYGQPRRSVEYCYGVFNAALEASA